MKLPKFQKKNSLNEDKKIKALWSHKTKKKIIIVTVNKGITRKVEIVNSKKITEGAMIITREKEKRIIETQIRIKEMSFKKATLNNNLNQKKINKRVMTVNYPQIGNINQKISKEEGDEEVSIEIIVKAIIINKIRMILMYRLKM